MLKLAEEEKVPFALLIPGPGEMGWQAMTARQC
jgi:hypothetical protein